MYLHNFELRSKTNNCNLLNLIFTIYERADGAWKSVSKLEALVKMCEKKQNAQNVFS